MINIFEEKKRKHITKLEAQEINALSKLNAMGDYEGIIVFGYTRLSPELRVGDAVKLMFHLIAVSKLGNVSKSVNIFRSMVFGNAFTLYEKPAQKYLKFYAFNILKGIYSETLEVFPKDIRYYKVERPELDAVSKNIKNIFNMELKPIEKK